MQKIEKPIALGMSIYALAKIRRWPYEIVKKMISWCGFPAVECDACEKKRCLDPEHGFRNRNLCFAKKITLHELLTALENEYAKATTRKYWVENEPILRRISNLGFTRLDFLALPQYTISIGDLKKISKEELLSLDARLLGCTPEYMANRYRKANGSSATVKDILAGRASCVIFGDVGEKKVRKILTQLGFETDDGVFMRYGSKYGSFIAGVRKDGDVSEEFAHMIAAKIGPPRF